MTLNAGGGRFDSRQSGQFGQGQQYGGSNYGQQQGAYGQPFNGQGQQFGNQQFGRYGQQQPTNNPALNAWIKPQSAPARLEFQDAQGMHNQMLNQEKQKRLEKYHETPPKKIAACISVGLGVLGLLSIFTVSAGESIIQNVATSITGAIMIGLPGAYWLWRNKQDHKLVSDWIQATASYHQSLGVMNESDRRIFASPEQVPEIPKRNWLAVWLIVAAAFVVFGIASPDTPTPSSTIPKTTSH